MITIIMPARNAEKTIKKAILSVVAQTFENWRLLIVDDCSTDRTAELISIFATKDSRIKLLLKKKQSGVAAARNYALQHVDSKFVAFLDSDDYWEPEKLMLQMHFLMQSKTAITYTQYRRVNQNGDEIGVVIPPQQLDYRYMLRSNFIGNLTAVYDRDRLPNLWFRTIGHEDYAFWLEALKELKEPILATPSNKPLANYRVGSSSLSSNKLRSAKWHWAIYRKTQKLGVIKSCLHMFFYVYYGVIKRYKPI